MAPCFENVVAFGLCLACKAHFKDLVSLYLKVLPSCMEEEEEEKEAFCQFKGSLHLAHVKPTNHASTPSSYNPQGYDSQIRQGPNFFHNIFSFVLVNNFY
jgi:hypothetical protein